jgi:hypothetical protein
MAAQAGLGVELLPLDTDPNGVATAWVYLEQIGVSPAIKDRILNLLPRFSERYMSLLSRQDSSPSYLLCFTRQPASARAEVSKPRTPIEATAVTCAMDIDVTPAGDVVQISVAGWCVAIPDAAWLKITFCGQTKTAPVWLPRPDVLAAVSGAGFYPSKSLLCSGVNQAFQLAAPQSDDWRMEASIIATDGTEFPLVVPAMTGRQERLVVCA